VNRLLALLQKKTGPLSAILIVGISSLVHAETPTESDEKGINLPWELYDTDKDGYISAKEAEKQKMPAQVFRSLDIDRDGRLNKDEFSTAPLIQPK
jgi:Ca2+-binding EF-hand superfamily protein